MLLLFGFQLSFLKAKIYFVKKLLLNLRFYILLASFLFSAALFVFSLVMYGDSQLFIKLTRYYAFSAVGTLYLTLLIGPSIRVFPWIPYKGKLIFARRGLGVSTFYFVVLHASFAFFGQLGGFAGLFYLDSRYLLAIGLSSAALIILALMAATSFDFMIRKLTYRWWKFIHRFVYLAGTLIVIHTFLIGGHFQNLFSPVALLSFVALAFLLAVEAIAWTKYLALKHQNLTN